MTVWAIVPAAGQGLRLGARVPKAYAEIAGRALLAHVIELFMTESAITGVAVAVAADDDRWAGIAPETPPKPLVVADGGATRAHSVLSALEAIRSRLAAGDWVLVHDAARPLLQPPELARFIESLREDPVGGILAAPVVDTLKRSDPDGRIAGTADRTALWRAFTPQMFRFGLLHRALSEALEAGISVTDEAMAIERLGQAPRLIEGSAGNIKITNSEDLAFADLILRARRGMGR